MQNNTEQILSDLVNNYADVLFHSNTKVRKIPEALTDKVSELKKAGVSFDEMGKSFKVSSKTVRNWVNKNKKTKQQELSPKRLYIRKVTSATLDNSQVSKIESPIVRLVFKSGVQLELQAASLDFKFLKLLNELGQ
jgi:DNA-binding transcriptional regulator YiaG